MRLRKCDLRLGRIEVDRINHVLWKWLCNNLTGVNGIDYLGERKSQGALAEPIRCIWQNIEDSKSSADRGFAVSEWVPGEANPRIEVVYRRIRYPIVLTWHRDTLKQARYRAERPMNLSREGQHFVPQAEVKCQVGTQAPIVLNIRSSDTFTNSGFKASLRTVKGEEEGIVSEEVR